MLLKSICIEVITVLWCSGDELLYSYPSDIIGCLLPKDVYESFFIFSALVIQQVKLPQGVRSSATKSIPQARFDHAVYLILFSVISVSCIETSRGAVGRLRR
jgi:hypothetical protein